MAEFSIGLLVPSWWEIEVAVAASLFVIAAYLLLHRFSRAEKETDRSLNDEAAIARDPLLKDADDKEKVRCAVSSDCKDFI